MSASPAIRMDDRATGPGTTSGVRHTPFEPDAAPALLHDLGKVEVVMRPSLVVAGRSVVTCRRGVLYRARSTQIAHRMGR